MGGELPTTIARRSTRSAHTAQLLLHRWGKAAHHGHRLGVHGAVRVDARHQLPRLPFARILRRSRHDPRRSGRMIALCLFGPRDNPPRFGRPRLPHCRLPRCRGSVSRAMILHVRERRGHRTVSQQSEVPSDEQRRGQAQPRTGRLDKDTAPASPSDWRSITPQNRAGSVTAGICQSQSTPACTR